MDRQRTLAATIDWSYELLGADERLLWSRLSVFAGGFDAEAVAHVAGEGPLTAESLPNLLSSLVAKSIIQREQVGDATRYRMLETLRQYGRERLRGLGEEGSTRRRHRDWVGQLAASAVVADSHQAIAFDRVERDLDNILSALDFCLTASDEAAAGLRICSDLETYWATRGPITDARRMISSFLERTPGAHPALASGLLAAGRLAIAQNDAPAARPLLEESLRLGRAAADSFVVGWSLDYPSVVHGLEGKHREALDLGRMTLTCARAIDDPVLAAAALAWMVSVVAQPGLGVSDADQSQALADAERSLAELEKPGELWTRSWLLNCLAVTRNWRGELGLAEESARLGVVLKHELGDGIGLAYALELLSWVAASVGNMRRAAQLLGGASRLLESTGAPMLDMQSDNHDRTVASARSSLGEARYRSTYEAGEAMTTDELVAFALDKEAPSASPQKQARARSTPLTAREMEISRLISGGMQTKEIAAKLFISDRTVETHVTNIMNKLGLASRLQVARWVASCSQLTVPRDNAR